MIRVLVVTLVLAATGLAVAQPNDAERLYTEGQAAYDRKDYATALDRWQRSYELSKLPALVFNIAQAHRLHGDCRAAVDSYRRFIALDPASGERADAEGFIKELEPKCPATPPRVPAVTKPKPKPTPASSRPVEHPPVGHPGRGKRWLGLGTGAVGVGLVVVGAVFGRKAQQIGDELDVECDNGCDWDAIRDRDADGRAAERNQYIFLGAGAAAIAAGGVLYWLGGRDAERAPVAVVPHAGGAVVSWSRRW